MREQFFDLRSNVGQRDSLRARLTKLRQKLLVVVTLDAFRVDLDGGPETRIDQPHHIELQRDVIFEVVVAESVAREHSAPGVLVGSCAGIVFANFCDAVTEILFTNVVELGRLHLLP